MVLRKGALDAGVGAATCDWTDTASLSLLDRKVVLENLQISTTICKEDFFNDWEAAQMGESAWRDTPEDLASWLTIHVLARGMQDLENMIWKGDGLTGSFLGFEPQITAAYVENDTANNDVPIDAGTGETVDATTVIDLFSAMIDAAPDSLKSQADFGITASFSVYEAYKAAIGAFDSVTPLWNANQALTFNGYPVRRANGMTSGAAIATTTSNLVFGTALLSDTTRIEVKSMDVIMEENVRFKAKFDAAVGVGCFGDIVTLNIATS